MTTEILVVCTGNLCRSPTAAALLARHLEKAREPTLVRSAGFLTEGLPANPLAVEVMREWGIDITSHRTTLVTPSLVSEASLVIGMTRAHVREVVALAASAWPRTFTLRELVRRAREVGQRPSDLDLTAWLAQVADGRSTVDLLGESHEDDVADPMGKSRRAFRHTAAELDALLGDLATLLWS